MIQIKFIDPSVEHVLDVLRNSEMTLNTLLSNSNIPVPMRFKVQTYHSLQKCQEKEWG